MGKEALLHIPIVAHIISCTKCVVVPSRQQLHTGDGAYQMVHMVHTVDRMQLIFAERTHLS
jgi:hypothetical protein